MGSLGNEPEFKNLNINALHPTFAAEVKGLDFRNLSDEQFKEILAAMAKVSACRRSTRFGALRMGFPTDLRTTVWSDNVP
jgi:hypothetical protein